LSESLSLFFPRHTVHSAARRTIESYLAKTPSRARVPFQGTAKTRPAHKMGTVRVHGVERPANAPAHRLAWNVLAYTHIRKLKNNLKLFLAKR
jgi:hypothetical protein